MVLIIMFFSSLEKKMLIVFFFILTGIFSDIYPCAYANMSGIEPIPNLESVIFKQFPPQKSDLYTSFYANGVELEPLTLILCGKKIVATDGTVSYAKIPASAATQVKFYADSVAILDGEYNPQDIIPLIHNNTHADPSKPGLSEPKFTYADSEKRKVLLIYDETSNYVKMYNQEGFNLGGKYTPPSMSTVSQHSHYTSNDFFQSINYKVDDSENACYSDQPPGVGETVTHLYLLATPALNGTSILKIYAMAKTDSTIDTEGPLTFSLPTTPVLTVDDFTSATQSIGRGIKDPGTFYSYFSSKVLVNNIPHIQEERGLVVCPVLVGAAFHGLYYYTDNKKLCKTSAPAGGGVDCNEHNCLRKLSISSISAKKVPLHDLASMNVFLGVTCPNKSGAFTAGFVSKPVLHSASTTKDMTDNFYTSYTGGVSAYYYPRDADNDDIAPMSKLNLLGGIPHNFYYFSYVFGISPSPGLSCHWNTQVTAEGHDMYGNAISIGFMPANGDKDLVIKNVF